MFLVLTKKGSKKKAVNKNMKTAKVCRRAGCGKKIADDGIKTGLGWFCSKGCLVKIQKRIMPEGRGVV